MEEEFTVNKRQKTDNNKIINSGNNKLSEYLFNIISIHLIHKQTIERVLELSLISKSTFKTIQNLLVSHELNRYKFIVTLPTLIKYIESSNQDNYKHKLIQFKEIERIKVPLIIGESSKLEEHDSENDDESSTLEKHASSYSEKENENEPIKKQLVENCPKLKKVVLLNKVDCKPDITYDYTCGGFFKVKKLQMYWDYESFPYTSEEEKVFDHDMEVFSEVVHHEFSFSYLLKYNPSRCYITTSLNESGLNIQNLTNLFKCKSINSFVFKDHRTPSQFFTNAIESSIKSLSVILNNKEEADEDEEKEEEDGDDDDDDDDDDEVIESISTLLSKVDIGSNKTLKKLILNRWVDADQYEVQFKQGSLIDTLQQLKLNKSLRTIGLQAFNIKDENILLPLCEMTNVQTLYIMVSERDALTAILNHLNQNSNIKKLHLIILNDSNCFTESNGHPVEYDDIFTNYFNNNNKSSLTSLVIKYQESYEHSNDENPNRDHPVVKILENSSNIKLKLKFKEFE